MVCRRTSHTLCLFIDGLEQSAKGKTRFKGISIFGFTVFLRQLSFPRQPNFIIEEKRKKIVKGIEHSIKRFGYFMDSGTLPWKCNG
jgi:hypothetical protein